jgi:hypothetical protein
MHWLLSADEYFPAKQAEQVELAERATLPAEQLSHELLSELGTEPAGQAVQKGELSEPE